MFYVICRDDKVVDGSIVSEFDSQREAENFMSDYIIGSDHHMDVRDFTVIEGRKLELATVEVIKKVRFK